MATAAVVASVPIWAYTHWSMFDGAPVPRRFGANVRATAVSCYRQQRGGRDGGCGGGGGGLGVAHMGTLKFDGASAPNGFGALSPM
jgi:hypothetical protein